MRGWVQKLRKFFWEQHSKDRDLYYSVLALLAVIAIVAVSMVYWAMFAYNAYSTFHEYWDLGNFAYNMYFYVHYPSIAHGLQYLIFANHIAPDQLLILPIYYLFQSPLTLLLVQDFVLSITGLIIFFVAKDLLKSNSFALLLSLAYLLNPGMHGMLVFDYHAEMLIIPFYILTFYYYMKLNRHMFTISLLLLLGTMESTACIVIAFAIGLLVHEFINNRDKKLRKNRVHFIVLMLVLSISLIAIDNFVYYYLAGAYKTSYPILPKSLEITILPKALEINELGSKTPVFPVNVSSLSSMLNLYGNLIGTTGSLASSGFTGYFAYGLLVAFLGFGISFFFDLIPAVLFSSPWLYGILFMGDFAFMLTWYQYFGFVLGGTIVASMLGLMVLMSRKKRYSLEMAKSLLLFLPLLLFLVSPIFLYSVNVNNLAQDLMLQVSPQNRTLYAQLDSIIALVPDNAPLMTQYFITPHVANRQYLEVTDPNMTYSFFKPEYIITDFNLNVSLNAFASNQSQLLFIQNYTETNYSIYARNGTAVLYKRN